MKKLFLAALMAATITPAVADVLEWTLPTTSVNGEALAPADITAVTVYRNGQPFAGLAGTATSLEVSSCKGGEFTVTASNQFGESGRSNGEALVVIPANCIPKPPAGVRFR